MPHGYPPWSGIKRDTIFALPLDLGELAARLGSIVTYDRRGDVVYLTSFENGLASWEQIVSGDGAAVRLSTAQAHSGAFSCELVAGLDDEREARIERHLPFPVEKAVGLEASFTLDPDTDHVRMAIGWYDGTYVRGWTVNYDFPNTTLACGGADGQHTALNSNLDLREDDEQFHTIKVVADLEEEEFARVMCDGLTYTPTTAAILKSADTTAPYLVIIIRHYGAEGAVVNPNIWVDNVIVTQNEP